VKGEKILISAMMINKYALVLLPRDLSLTEAQWMVRSAAPKQSLCRLCNQRAWLRSAAKR
jgi:hypothetical protein